jgi:hypothetical protein
MSLRATVLVPFTILAVSLSCDPPDLERLELRMGYDEVARIVGAQCEARSDEGYRELKWIYKDGTSIVAGIHDGRASGIQVHYPDGFPGRRGKADAMLARGIQGDSPEPFLRKVLGDDPLTVEDHSDRDCHWELSGGELTAIFKRGELHEARWTKNQETVTYVEVTDPVALLIEDLQNEHDYIRVQALQGVQEHEDPRIAEALLSLLRHERDTYIRSQSALQLARLGETRASELLLPDLRQEIIPEDIIRAIGEIGDERAADALQAAYDRSRNAYIKKELSKARQRILNRNAREAGYDRVGR